MERIDLNNKTILVTGGAGFIGANLIKRLLTETKGTTIINVDNLNTYYEVSLKEYRLKELERLSQAPSNPSSLSPSGVSAASSNPGSLSPTGVSASPSSPGSLSPSGVSVPPSSPGSLSPTVSPSGVTYRFLKADIADKPFIDKLFAEYKPQIVVNLAAQAGVRYSIENPDAYIMSNMMGFYNILEACRHFPVEHLVYASSSSVYGGNKKVPFSTDDRVDNPVSLYAATKKSNELFAHCYSKLYNIPTTGLRFFTVYGPAGRPDMAYFGFTNKLLKGETIQIFNYGNCRRDFTYVDDIVEGIIRVMQGAPERKVGSDAPYAIYNIGGGHPENLLDFVNILQEELIRAGVLPQDYDFEAHKQLVPMQPGDVPTTYADTNALERDFGFTPKIMLREGLRKFAEWYKEYYC